MVFASLLRSISEPISPGVELEQLATAGSKPQIAKKKTSFVGNNVEDFCIDEH